MVCILHSLRRASIPCSSFICLFSLFERIVGLLDMLWMPKQCYTGRFTAKLKHDKIRRFYCLWDYLSASRLTSHFSIFIYYKIVRNYSSFTFSSTRRCLDTLPATQLTTASDARPTRPHSADTRTFLFSRMRSNLRDTALIEAGPRIWNNLPTELIQPDLSTCHAAVSDSRWRHFCLVSGTKTGASPSAFNCALVSPVLVS